MHGDMGLWGFMMIPMALFWMGFPALILWAGWSAFRPRADRSHALDLLKETYARGQITRDQFEQARKDLA
jgi:putative membrane protein